MSHSNIPVEALISLLAAGSKQGQAAATDLWSVTTTALAMLIGDLHREGVVDAELLADRLLRQADQPEASALSRQATELLAQQVLGAAAHGDPRLPC